MEAPPPLPRNEAEKNIALSLILTLITCGIYGAYWNYSEMRALNGLLGREEYKFWKWMIFTLLTCGIYHVYYEYKMGLGVVEVQEKYGMQVDRNFPMICLGLSVFGLTLAADAIQQNEINKIYAKGIPVI